MNLSIHWIRFLPKIYIQEKNFRNLLYSPSEWKKKILKKWEKEILLFAFDTSSSYQSEKVVEYISRGPVNDPCFSRNPQFWNIFRRFWIRKTIPLLFVTAENADAELVVNQSSLQAPLSLSLFEYPARCKISGYGGYRDLIRIQEERGGVWVFSRWIPFWVWLANNVPPLCLLYQRYFVWDSRIYIFQV